MDNARIGRRSLLGAAGLLAAHAIPAQAARAKPRVAIRTARGVIVVELEARKAPITSANFLHYVQAGKFEGGEIYRASRTPGEPTHGTIQGWPAPTTRRFPPIAHESTTLTGLIHDTGTISMGRYGAGTATADFFICASPEPYLDAHPDQPGDNKGFAAFGQVVEGMDIVRTILALPTKGKAYLKEMRGQMLTTPVPIVGMKRLA
ncbi:MAG: peptidyl-prolyl cis-trans isomerase cyclophilin type [Caulobacteraceae bacterium]|jgi:peptidyl-prolyl cis-trans isomerase A (cyclophilin A)|nr:peptidyl-prolyl cis-trans isomerase cyclophilin type [Caulobacteraceae bacterium]